MVDFPIYWLPYFLWMGSPLLALLGAAGFGGVAAWLATRARIVWALVFGLVGSVLVPFVAFAGVLPSSGGPMRLLLLLVVAAAVIVFVYFRRASRRD